MSIPQAMIQDALLRLMGGAELMPFEQEMLSQMPLPDCVLTPFLGQEADMKESLRVTAKAVDTWGEEARKANYFTKHYITLSKMILNGVTVLGRGLATLHANGEDLSLAPKSIDELIKIASWHLHLSYIGVMQTVKSYPDVSTRLLNNQLSWASLIFRLFKTKEKLAKPVKQPALNQPEQPVLEGKQKPALGELKPVEATPSFGAARSLAPIAGTVSRGGANKAAASMKEEPAEMLPINEITDTAEEVSSDHSLATNEGNFCSESDRMKPEPSGTGLETAPTEGGDCSPKEGCPRSADAAAERYFPGKASTPPEYSDCQGQSDRTDGKRSSGSESDRAKSEPSGAPSEPSETGLLGGESAGGRSSCSVSNRAKPEPIRAGPELSSKISLGSSGAPASQCATEPSPIKPEDPTEQEPPKFFEIFLEAARRSKDPDRLSFTLDEVRQLTEDPQFCRYDPKTAAQFRSILARAGP